MITYNIGLYRPYKYRQCMDVLHFKVPVLIRLIKTLLFILPLFILTTGCNNNNLPLGVSEALDLAGENRKELEKTIKHYKRQGNNDKLQSAYFLIKNMPGKYGLYHKDSKLYINITAKTRSKFEVSDCQDLIDNYVEKQIRKLSGKQTSPLKIPDIEIVASDFLIENIDLAYKVWKEKPWAKHLNFKEYCQWLLPYRVMDEPLQNWRAIMYQNLLSLEDSLTTPDSPQEICMEINQAIANKFMFSSKFGSMPLLGGKDLWDTKTGICDHRYLLVALAMRSMGVPVAIDFTNQFSYSPGSHAWTVLLDSDKSIKPFNGGEKKVRFYVPANCPVWYEGVSDVTTVFRRVFENNKNYYLTYKGAYLPPYLKEPFIENVSSQYDTSRRGNITVPINGDINQDYAYLFCFGKGENYIIVDCEKVNNNSVTFNNIGRGIYFVCFIAKNSIVINSHPFIWEPPKSITYIKPNLKKNTSLTAYRKYPVQGAVYQFIDELNGMQLQGSNNKEFKNYDILYTRDVSDNVFGKVNLKTKNKYRYFRVVPNDSAEIHIAEVQLFYKNNRGPIETIKGKVLGFVPDVESCNDGILENAFDGNIRTNFNAPLGSWVGIDAGKQIEIKSFRLIVRNHLNIIEPGDSYELFYFNKDWLSLGEKTAQDYSLKYSNIPEGSLLLLKNNTKGVEERIFMIENNAQSWK